jgi:hypothetical protein
MNPLTPYLVWIKAGVLLALLVGAYALGRDHGGDRVQAKFDAHMAADAKAEAKALADARKAEQAKAAELAEIAEKYEKDKADAQAAADRTIADLRSGAIRLRSHWQGCQATGRVSGDATSATIADAAEQLREASAARIIGIGREADAKERALQEVIRAYQSP